MDSDLPASAPPPRLFKRIDLLGLLAVGLYGCLTLLPDSSTLILSWPWIIVWEITLFIPWLWLIKHCCVSQSFTTLDFGLDFGAGIAIIGLLSSTFWAPFPQKAIWFSWAAFSTIVALYGLNIWCSNQQKRTQLLTIQAYLGSALILVSLWLWSSQTFFPEIDRLNLLRDSGLDISYDFSTLELRNWAPFGHQNYVAGYLVLSLPLLLGQCLIAKQQLVRCGWGISVGLGLFTLYTTSSRGGWLGLLTAMGLGIIILLASRGIPIWLKFLPGLVFIAILGLALMTNNRLRNLFSTNPLEILGGDSYRLITHVTGWLMGKDTPILGSGLGSVPLLFQKHRPAWAGLEAEWHFQLHSTLVNIWAELGIWGITLIFGLLGWLMYWGIKLWRSPYLTGSNRILCWSLLSGLAGYSIVCLTDYQLDIIAITGTLIVYIVCLLSLLRDISPSKKPRKWHSPKLKILAYSLMGLLVAISLWLTPILWAWQLSSLGFEKLQNKEIGPFVEALERSHQLAPWEPYYLYQLGSHIGKIGLNSKDKEFRKTLLDQSQTYFEASVQASPYQEYGFTSLGWLQLNTQQSAEAVQSFTQASRLFPGRKLAFHELGLSLLAENKIDLAVMSFSLEIVRNPIWMTSPVWNSQQLKPLYPEVIRQVEKTYQTLVQQINEPTNQTTLHRSLGSLYWWQGNSTLAKKHWQLSQTQSGLDLLGIDKGQGPMTETPIYQAWLNKPDRKTWVEKAFLQQFKEVPNPKNVQTVIRGMNKATSFENWLKQNPVTVYVKRTRIGFGINAGHIDGPPLQDFSVIVNNYAIGTFFSNLFEMPIYDSSLDSALDPLRENLWTSIENQ